MLSYRHGFHAGSPADVLKHSALIFCLDYLVQKEKPCLLVDTHGGAGSYFLDRGFAAQNREWEAGLRQLAEAAGESGRPLPPLLARYLELAREALPIPGGQAAAAYPGSPVIMARFLRERDRLVCFELQGGDFDALRAALAPHPGAEARREDGLKALAGLLPPPSRRGCVLIDPSYEIKEDFTLVPQALRMALKRFPGGIYLVWYPLLAREEGFSSAGFAEELMGLCQGNRCRLELRAMADAAPRARSPRGFYGSGLVICNPPWTLRPALEASLPVLSAALGTDFSLNFEP